MQSLMMKNIALAALMLTAAVSIAQNAAPAAAQKSKAHILDKAELDALLAKPEQLLIVDVRRPDEVSSIGGFPVYFSVQIAELEKSTAWIPKDRNIVVISNHAGRGARGADILAAKGFKVVGAIGAQNYEEAGGKLVKVAAKPAANAAAK